MKYNELPKYRSSLSKGSFFWAASWQNQKYGMCAQQRLRSAWASAQSNKSLRLCSVGSSGPKLSSCGQRRLCSDWADAQAELSLRWAHKPVCWFCHEVAHIITLLRANCVCILSQKNETCIKTVPKHIWNNQTYTSQIFYFLGRRNTLTIFSVWWIRHPKHTKKILPLVHYPCWHSQVLLKVFE